MEVREPFQRAGHVQHCGGILIPGGQGKHTGRPAPQFQGFGDTIAPIGPGKSGEQPVRLPAKDLQVRGKDAPHAQEPAQVRHPFSPGSVQSTACVPPEKPQIFSQRRPEQLPALLFQRVQHPIVEGKEGERLTHSGQRPSGGWEGADPPGQGLQFLPGGDVGRRQLRSPVRRGAQQDIPRQDRPQQQVRV